MPQTAAILTSILEESALAGVLTLVPCNSLKYFPLRILDWKTRNQPSGNELRVMSSHTNFYFR